MKDKKINPSSGGSVYTTEAVEPGRVTQTPSQIQESTAAQSAQKVIEFDGRPGEMHTDDLTGDKMFDGPVDLTDRNPIVIDPPEDL